MDPKQNEDSQFVQSIVDGVAKLLAIREHDISRQYNDLLLHLKNHLSNTAAPPSSYHACTDTFNPSENDQSIVAAQETQSQSLHRGGLFALSVSSHVEVTTPSVGVYA